MQLTHLNRFLQNSISEKKPFALYALPGEDMENLSLLIDKHVDIIRQDELANSEGFIFAPYHTGAQPIYLFSNRDKPNKMPSEESVGKHSFFLKKVKRKTPTVSSRSHFKDIITTAQNKINLRELDKVVLSRPIIIENISLTAQLASLFSLLCDWYPTTLKYLVYTPCGQLWMGATPETLIEINNKEITSMSLSGTRKANENIEWTQKEIEEHEWVVSYIESALRESNCTNILKRKVKTIKAGPVEHLQTDFSAQLENSSRSWDLIFRMHPTPAVCGFPLQNAKDFINQYENYDRSYYTGFLGPVSTTVKKLFVNLRCMQLFPDKLVLYVGAGITADSKPELEWKETELKSKTLLHAIEKIATFAAANNQ